MKLLFDENLPPSLVQRLAPDFPGSASVFSCDLASHPDQDVILFAKQNDFAIVSKDADFYRHCVAHGAPPKVIWVRCGNVSPSSLEAVFRAARGTLLTFSSSDDAFLILR